MLSILKFEVPDNIYLMHAATPHNTEYRIQTALGTSTNHHEHSESDPIHGNSQGAWSLGTNWVYISIPIMSTSNKHEEGCTLVSPDKKIKRKK